MEELDMNAPEERVKLFVGQIHCDIDEEFLKSFFGAFGPIADLTVIRDNASNISKGCAFVTFFYAQSARNAVEKLHDKVKLPNSANLLQVRIAETQQERENKLFIGMLPKTLMEEDLQDMFGAFGELREVHIIRGPDGGPKGCAFVKFVDKYAAMAAIQHLHNMIPQGSSRPLVVKFADNKKPVGGRSGPGLEQPTLYQPPMRGTATHQFYGATTANNWMNMNVAATGNRESHMYAQPPQPVHAMRTMAGGQPQQSLNQLQGIGMSMHVANQQQPMAQFMPMSPYMQHQISVTADPRLQTQHYVQQQNRDHRGDTRSIGYASQPLPQQIVGPRSGSYYNTHIGNNSPQQPTATGGGQYRYTQTQTVGGGRPSATLGSENGVATDPPKTNRASEPLVRSPVLQMNANNGDGVLRHLPNISNDNTDSNVDSQMNRPPEGPTGANLFIYHLPRDLTDADLATLFATFGNVISAKVYVDKRTADSKGFGFVSFDTANSASAAIAGMNGFQIGSKRLKVQHKRIYGSESNSPMGNGQRGGGGGAGSGNPRVNESPSNGHVAQGVGRSSADAEVYATMNIAGSSGYYGDCIGDSRDISQILPPPQQQLQRSYMYNHQRQGSNDSGGSGDDGKDLVKLPLSMEALDGALVSIPCVEANVSSNDERRTDGQAYPPNSLSGDGLTCAHRDPV